MESGSVPEGAVGGRWKGGDAVIVMAFISHMTQTSAGETGEGFTIYSMDCQKRKVPLRSS